MLISILYLRLGVLGFLTLGNSLVSGNQGLKDQVEALKWVQRQIAAFGGDPDRVTVAGQSAGSHSIHALILSPLAQVRIMIMPHIISESGRKICFILSFKQCTYIFKADNIHFIGLVPRRYHAIR